MSAQTFVDAYNVARRLKTIEARDFTAADSARFGKTRDRTSSVTAATLVAGRGNVW
jgi:hypothetical protein